MDSPSFRVEEHMDGGGHQGSSYLTARREFPDIARGALVLLVVWGHLLESKGYNGRLYFAIYAFHMPAFAMISGAYSKPALNRNHVLEIFKRLLIPLLCFQFAYYVSLGYFAPERVSNLHTPVWIMWFLFSILTWKLALPLAIRLPYPFLLSILVALAAGFSDRIGAGLSFSRTLVFFPAFLFGHLYAKRIFEAPTRYRTPLIIVFITIFIVALLISDYVSIRWLWGSHPYTKMLYNTPGAAFRVAAMFTGIIMSVAFLAILPTHSKMLACLGRRTMTIYLLHGFPVIIFWTSGALFGNGLLFLATTALLSLGISLLISLCINRLLARSWGRP